MTQICPICSPTKPYGPELFQCPIHLVDLRPYVPPSDPGPVPPEPPSAGQLPSGSTTLAAPKDAEAWSPMVCWNCGTEATAGNGECLSPGCNKPLMPPALVIVFAYGQVEIQPGEQAELGREGPYQRLFRSFPNVSRRHAEVGVDVDGAAWMVHRSTTNETLVNGMTITRDVRHSLRHRDRVRLARHAEGTVRIFRR